MPSPPQLLTDDPSTTSQRIQSQLVEPLTALKARAQAEQPQSEAVAAVHADGLCSCGSSTLSSRSYGRRRTACSRKAPGMVLESLEEFNKSLALFDRWIARMSNLRAAAK